MYRLQNDDKISDKLDKEDKTIIALNTIKESKALKLDLYFENEDGIEQSADKSLYVLIDFENKVRKLFSKVNAIFCQTNHITNNSSKKRNKSGKTLMSKEAKSTKSKPYQIYFDNEVRVNLKDSRSIKDLVKNSEDTLKTAFKIVFYDRKDIRMGEIESINLTKDFTFEEYFEKYLLPEKYYCDT